MNKIRFILVTSLILLVSCAPQPTFRPRPVHTSTPVPATPTSQFIALKNGGFSLTVQPELDFDTNDYSINLSDKRAELVISLNGRPYIESSYTLESFLNQYVAEMASRGGSFNQSDSYEILVDGISGLGMDLTGTFLGDPIAGKAVIVSPGKDFIVFGFAMSNISVHKNGWTDSGRLIFEQIIDSIKFKEEVKK